MSKEDKNEKSEESVSGDFFSIDTNTVSRKEHTIYIRDNIEGDISKILQVLKHSKPEDSIEFHINSYGGFIHIVSQIINGVECCQGEVKAIGDGMCCSAASVLLLNMPTIYIRNNCTMLIHYYSGAVYGKGQEIKSYSNFMDTWMRSFFRKTYNGFLTESELNYMFNGKDYWFGSSEISRRLDNMVSMRKCEDEN